MTRAILVAWLLVVPALAHAQAVDDERPPPVDLQSRSVAASPSAGPVALGWPSSPSPMPREHNPRYAHEPDTRTVVAASILGGVGWVGAIVVGAIALGGADMSGRTCDANLGWSIVPIVGVPIGIGTAFACPERPSSGFVTGGLSLGGVLVMLDGLFEALEVAGLVIGLFGGLIGERVLVSSDVALRLTPFATAQSGGLGLALTF